MSGQLLSVFLGVGPSPGGYKPSVGLDPSINNGLGQKAALSPSGLRWVVDPLRGIIGVLSLSLTPFPAKTHDDMSSVEAYGNV